MAWDLPATVIISIIIIIVWSKKEGKKLGGSIPDPTETSLSLPYSLQ